MAAPVSFSRWLAAAPIPLPVEPEEQRLLGELYMVRGLILDVDQPPTADLPQVIASCQAFDRLRVNQQPVCGNLANIGNSNARRVIVGRVELNKRPIHRPISL